MPDYEVGDGHDSKPFSESGSEKKSPVHEQIMDYTSVQRMQGSRRKEHPRFAEVDRGLQIQRVEVAVQRRGFGSNVPPHHTRQQ